MPICGGCLRIVVIEFDSRRSSVKVKCGVFAVHAPVQCCASRAFCVLQRGVSSLMVVVPQLRKQTLA